MSITLSEQELNDLVKYLNLQPYQVSAPIINFINHKVKQLAAETDLQRKSTEEEEELSYSNSEVIEYQRG